MATDEEAISKRVSSVLETHLERDKVHFSIILNHNTNKYF